MAGIITITSNTIIGNSGYNSYGTASSKVIGPLTITGTGSVVAITDLTFTAAQFQTVTSPVGATGAVITPPVGNLVGLTLKGVTGDTGIPLQPSQPFIITFAVPTQANTFGLLSAAAITGTVEVSFF